MIKITPIYAQNRPTVNVQTANLGGATTALSAAEAAKGYATDAQQSAVDSAASASDSLISRNQAEGFATDAHQSAVDAQNSADSILLDAGFIAVSADLANIDAVAGDLTNINNVANDLTNINTVAINIDDVTSIANDLTNINNVANDLVNIDAVAGDLTNINTVASDSSNIATIVSDISSINTVATNITTVGVVATNITNVNNVANDIANIDTLVSNLSNINSVYSNNSNISTVASGIGNVATVSNNISSINAVNTNLTAIGSVVAGLSNINTVSSSISNINTVASVAPSLSTVITAIPSITAVAPITSDVTTVAGISSNVTTVAGISSSVASVATNSTNINTVGLNIGNVNYVGSNISNVNSVANNMLNINSVSGISTSITTVASNISAVQNANANAISAQNSAISAQNSATSAASSASTATTQASLSSASQLSASSSASLAAGYAASASSVVQQDLSAVSAGLHRSPNAITAMYIYDTSKDSDGGAWTEKCQHTSWYNESLNGKWLGQADNEILARAVNGIYGSELVNINTQALTSCTGSKSGSGWNVTATGFDVQVFQPNILSQGMPYTVTVKWAGNVNARSIQFRLGGNNGVYSLGTAVSGSVTYTAVSGTQNTSAYFYLTNAVVGDTFYFEITSVKGFSSTTTAAGDYFQLTTDGKFYSLNKNLLTSTPALATQTQWLTAGTYTLSSTTASSGSVAVSGAATASHTAGGSATTFTVATSGNVTFTVTGSVTTAQCELGSSATTYQANASTTRYTETFRGNKAKFPKVSAIIAEATNVTIYDLTEPGRPMWMRFVRGVNNNLITSTGDVSGLSSINGVLTLSQLANYGGVTLVNFPSDSAKRYRYVLQTFRGCANGIWIGWISNRNTANGYDGSQYSIVNENVNAVAMTVLPDAPVDPVSGLKVPTIAVGTGGGVSVIRHDGVVVNSADANATKGNIAFDRLNRVLWSNIYYTVYCSPVPPLSAGFSNQSATSVSLGGTTFSANNVPIKPGISSSGANVVKNAISSIYGVSTYKAGQSSSRVISSAITNTYNTGHMLGDIRRAYLADATVGSASQSNLVVNGDFSTSTLTNWGAQDGNIATAVVSGQLQISLNNAAGSSTYAYYNLQTKPGYTYTVTSDIFLNTVTSFFYSVRDGFLGGTGTIVNGTTQTSNGTYSITFQALSEYTSIRFYAGGYSARPCSFFVDNLTVVNIAEPDRSYKAKSATITGTLTKALSATNNQLVAYSGFSASNYLQEPYSADLDFGTGDWSVGAWCNVPSTLALSGTGFPVVGSELFPALDFTTGGTAGGVSSRTVNSFTTTSAGGITFGTPVLTIGRSYLVTITGTTTAGNFTFRNSTSVIGSVNAPSGSFSINQVIFGWSSSTTSYFQNDSAGTTTITSISVKEVLPICILDRSYSSGAFLRLGVTGSGYLVAWAYDGTTTRTVTTTTAYNIATWIKAEVTYKAGKLAILVNGIEVAATYGAPLLTLNNSNAVLTIGNSYALDAPFPGSLALLKLSATVPTPEQAQWMYAQEMELFRDGANCLLPDANAILDLTYDDATDSWMAVSSANESRWCGLIRTGVTAVPAGTYSKLVANSGIRAEARITTSPGVDITIPAYGLREELFKKAERLAATNQDIVTFDYAGGFTATTSTTGAAAYTLTSVAGILYPAQCNLIGAVITGSGITTGTTIVAVSGTTIYIDKPATAAASGVQIALTDFPLPVGYETRSVLAAGSLKYEGSTKDYTRLFDGFKETIRFGTAPAYNANIQIQAVRAAQ